MTVDSLLSTACPIIRDTGWAFYFAPTTIARGGELGLDPLQTYVLGRGGVLGDVEAPVVSAAFGYFNPAFLGATWDAARAICAPRVAGAAFMECCAAHGRDKLDGLPGLDAFVAAATKVNDTADADGLALYAAVRSEPLAADPAGRAMQLVAVLRELRGSAHLVALRAVGLDSKTAHFAKRPGDAGMFGWTDADAPDVTDETHRLLADAEAITDLIVRPAFAALDGDEAAALIDGLQAIQAAL